MIIAADATTYARKLEEMLKELERERVEITASGAGLDDFAAYQFEVGFIKGIRECMSRMIWAAQDLSGNKEPSQQ